MRRLTRRSWAKSVSSAAAAVVSTPAAALAQGSPPDPMQALREQIQRNRDAVSAVPLDPLVEPAFRFEA